ncbi:ethanolamine ammonia-lyase subunit EutC [Granulicella sp. dw_53]|uniref:ethanolamine ammonia-lyase subunit EutC n=1 Tax=Granulicella sp. dw_53 TaxID=2719792 RepID=UPI001BD5340F|nr:ethanolamine ammonia-lyase subunit EutC [Granulicella sp. dw_53]
MSELPSVPIPSLDLRDYTSARVALTRNGVSLSTRDSLDFALAHAQARDAVHATLSLPSLLEALRTRNLPVITLKSAAPDRATYLRRPDLGRTLNPASVTQLATYVPSSQRDTLAIIFADGLSALALDRHVIPLLDELLPLIAQFILTPIVIVEQARVAIGDPIGQALHADLSLLLIGERPGLSSPDSLGAYLTFAPRPGRTDAERNCVSNIRPQGLDYPTAAIKIAALANEAHRRQLAGIALKDLAPTLLKT